MTKSMADERRYQLERYLQNVGNNQNISSSELFICYFKDLQMDTFRIQEHKVDLDVYLPNGRRIRIDVQTSDSAERVMEIVSHKLDLHRELTGYFSLFLIQDPSTVLKRVVEFELPCVTLHSMKDGNLKLQIRKWYMDPSMDKVLFDNQASITLLYLQALQEIEQQWSRPTNEQLVKLNSLEKSGNYVKFLELMQEVRQYGCIQLDLCTIDHPEPDCEARIAVGSQEMHCCVKLGNNTTEEIAFKVNMIRCWQVTFLGAVHGERTDDEKMELKFEYDLAGSWKWITIYTKQAFLLSTCLKKTLSEELLKQTKSNLEMQIEVPEVSKVTRTSSKLQQTVVPFRKNTEKVRISWVRNINSTFPETGEDGL
ncbi:sorting nexin-31 isoform X2 [Lissotriton helveticus]